MLIRLDKGDVLRYLKFSIVPLFYLPLLIVASLLGGWFPLANLAFIILCYFTLDKFSEAQEKREPLRWPWLLDAMMYLYLLLSLVAIAAVLASASGGQNAILSWADEEFGMSISPLASASFFSILAAAISTGFVLSINMVVGHELTHRTVSKFDIFMGNLALSIVGDSQFAISHIYCHHKNVATPLDAATARRGESIYRFIIRSSLEQYREAWQFEKSRLIKTSRSVFSPANRLLLWISLTFVIAITAFIMAGWVGGLLYILIAVVSKITYESTNYIQHYGLVRIPGQRVRTDHSWDCRSAFSSAVLLNLTRHSDHHASPNKAYWHLDTTNSRMLIDQGYVVQIVRALYPTYWFNMMEEKLLYWELHHATEDEREIIAQQRQAWRKENV